MEEVASRMAESALEKGGEHHNLIRIVGVEMSSPMAGHHCSTTRSRRK
jgi:hypothetical protein